MPLTYDSPEMIYVLQYCYKYYPEYDYDEITGESYPVPPLAVDVFIKRYDSILSSLPKQFTKEKFDAFEQIQECLEELKLTTVEHYADDKEKENKLQGKTINLNRQKLSGQALFGFLVFLYYTVNRLFEEDTQIAYTDAIDEINRFITDNIENNLKIKLTSGRKSKEVSDPLLLKALFAVFNCKENYYHELSFEQQAAYQDKTITTHTTLGEGAPFISRPLSATERRKSYMIIKIIMEEVLQWNIIKNKYAPAETTLGLCLLHFCGFLLGDPTDVCDQNNAITLIKLMNDFKNTSSHIPDSAFLYIFYDA